MSITLPTKLCLNGKEGSSLILKLLILPAHVQLVIKMPIPIIGEVLATVAIAKDPLILPLSWKPIAVRD